MNVRDLVYQGKLTVAYLTATMDWEQYYVIDHFSNIQIPLAYSFYRSEIGDSRGKGDGDGGGGGEGWGDGDGDGGGEGWGNGDGGGEGGGVGDGNGWRNRVGDRTGSDIG